MNHSDTHPLTVHQQLLMHLERRIAATSSADIAGLPKATGDFQRELDRLTEVLSKLDDCTRQRIVLAMTHELNVFMYLVAVAAADIITKPLCDQALRERNESILDDAVSLFEELIGTSA